MPKSIRARAACPASRCPSRGRRQDLDISGQDVRRWLPARKRCPYRPAPNLSTDSHGPEVITETPRDFPVLPLPRPVGSEINPPSVVGPAGIEVVERVIGQSTRLSTIRAYHKDYRALAKDGIEHYLLTIWRPARK